ncbi:GGDEF domain-containing protein [Shewanella colwelliana]|uniref:GGDEF domain-containing protein n=1 Tax=Shewanella colwelliana TaxID=23 RepID=UPI001BBD2FD5|nr:GGDEF domain-containing protein [Shewanella colwelliana]GIU19661.1 GGDEF domain-containing protein [Shewanella colwelliana]
MGKIKRLQHALSEKDNDAAFLLQGSKKTLFVILTIVCVMFVPLAIKNILVENYLLACLLGLFILLVIIDVLALHRGQVLPINKNAVMTILVASLGITINQIGASAIYWAFPMVISIIYILPFRSSLTFNGIILAIVTFEAFIKTDSASAIRASVALALTIIISGLIILHINRLKQNLINESIRDPMTNAFNRRQLGSHLSSCLAQKQRNDIDSGILMLDIDHFKKINDTFGHSTGDMVLKRVTQLLFKHIRETDLLFRVGGEEFLLLMHNIDSHKAKQVAEKIRKIIEKEVIIDNYPITVSIGISMALAHIDDDNWMRHADHALYDAKESGRNQIKMHQPLSNYCTTKA